MCKCNAIFQSIIFGDVSMLCTDVAPDNMEAQCILLLQILWDGFMVLHKYRYAYQGFRSQPLYQIFTYILIFNRYLDWLVWIHLVILLRFYISFKSWGDMPAPRFRLAFGHAFFIELYYIFLHTLASAFYCYRVSRIIIFSIVNGPSAAPLLRLATQIYENRQMSLSHLSGQCTISFR